MVMCTFFFFFAMLHESCGILVLQPGMEPVPLQWKHGAPATGPPGKSLYFFLELSLPCTFPLSIGLLIVLLSDLQKLLISFMVPYTKLELTIGEQNRLTLKIEPVVGLLGHMIILFLVF